jgi:hypothetical protein
MVQIDEREEIEKLESLKKESNAEATDRISKELKDERKLEARKNCVKSFFKMLTGEEMTEEQFIVYNNKFNKAKSGYNIKSYIRDIGLKCLEEFNKDILEKKEDDNNKEITPE